MSRRFSKPSLGIRDQIEHLRRNGMVVADVAYAEHWLSTVSYYRLSGYWLPFEHPKGVSGPRFKPGTNFNLVTDLYSFDRKLRRHIGRAVEHVEVALRGSWAYELAQAVGAHGYLDAALYSRRAEFHDNLAKLSAETGRSVETYIFHYRETYDDPALPAVWMAAEMMSFGQLSRWYSLLADRALRNRIALRLGLPEAVLVPVIKHLVTVRNVCAHHGRLWNRRFRASPALPKKPRDLAATIDQTAGSSPGYLYNTLVLLLHLLRTIAPASTWRNDTLLLLDAHDWVDLAVMGFPADWRSRPMWR